MGSRVERDLVVLLHGQPGAGVEWHRVIRSLGDSVDVLAPDRPGYGANALPAGGVEENVEWLTRLVEDEGGGRTAVIVAHSWAGSVALSMALHRPDLTRAIGLVGSVGPGAITRTDRVLARPILGAVATWPFFRIGDAVLRQLAARRPPEDDVRQRTLETLRASRSRGVWRSFLVEQMALVDEVPGVFEELARIAAYTQVVAGTRDRVVPFATARALAARLPHATLVTVRRGGHGLHRTHPALIADVVRELLAASDVS